MNTDLMFSSKTAEWETPQAFFDRLNWKYHFTLDAAAQPENAKCERYFTPKDDGLAKNWGGADRVVQSTIRQRDREMGEKGIRGIKGISGRYAASRQDGHKMVSRLLHQGSYHIPAWSAEIWRRENTGTVPEYGR